METLEAGPKHETETNEHACLLLDLGLRCFHFAESISVEFSCTFLYTFPSIILMAFLLRLLARHFSSPVIWC